MHSHLWKRLGALCFAGALALAGCSGEDGGAGPPGAAGPTGPTGPSGQDLTATAEPESCWACHPTAGTSHQAIYDQYTDASTLVAAIETVASTPKGTTPETYDVVVTFALTKNGAPFNVTVNASNTLPIAQKTFYATRYDPATRRFDPTVQLTRYANLGGGRYTVTNTSATAITTASFAPETSNAIVYGYFAENPTLIPASGHYSLYDNVASVAVEFGTADTFVSAANVQGCEKCHGTPYMKHGYRAGAVAGIPDMAACKACHYDSRGGSHQAWQFLVDDPLAYATAPVNASGEVVLTAEQNAKYAYVATTMNDTHMSHAMEFAYPQTMANCVACHEGKLDMVLSTATFTLATCKSCHPVTGVGGTDPKRAPALLDIIPVNGSHTAARADLYNFTGVCNTCHADGGGMSFADIHPGFNAAIYANETTKFADTVKVSIGAATYDAATHRVTIPLSATGVGASDLVKPTVVVSLYGYDTKDFVVSGHGSRSDGTRNLEWTEGACQRGTGGAGQPACLPANNPALDVTPLASAGNAAWTAVADLTTWAARIADGSVKRIEIAVLPELGTKAVGGDAKTFDLTAGAVVADADAYGKAIVSAQKCNACHEALGTTFHTPNYGSAGVVGCRVCHVVGSGGSHLEMQSRSIDSYVHAIHSMQPFDVASIDFADPVEELHYSHHVESTYPNFTLLNCESCHNSGTFEVPDQSRSLVGVLSASANVTTLDRLIGTVPSVVVGPGSRACGSCHRAHLINEDAAGHLAAFDAHTASNGTRLANGTGVFDAAVAKIMALFE
jgi:hypothetical protein